MICKCKICFHEYRKSVPLNMRKGVTGSVRSSAGTSCWRNSSKCEQLELGVLSCTVLISSYSQILRCFESRPEEHTVDKWPARGSTLAGEPRGRDGLGCRSAGVSRTAPSCHRFRGVELRIHLFAYSCGKCYCLLIIGKTLLIHDLENLLNPTSGVNNGLFSEDAGNIHNVLRKIAESEWWLR